MQTLFILLRVLLLSALLSAGGISLVLWLLDRSLLLFLIIGFALTSCTGGYLFQVLREHHSMRESDLRRLRRSTAGY